MVQPINAFWTVEGCLWDVKVMSYVQCYHSVDNEYSLNHLLVIRNSILDHGWAVETVYIIWEALNLGKHPFLLLNGTVVL